MHAEGNDECGELQLAAGMHNFHWSVHTFIVLTGDYINTPCQYTEVLDSTSCVDVFLMCVHSPMDSFGKAP